MTFFQDSKMVFSMNRSILLLKNSVAFHGSVLRLGNVSWFAFLSLLQKWFGKNWLFISASTVADYFKLECLFVSTDNHEWLIKYPVCGVK